MALPLFGLFLVSFAAAAALVPAARRWAVRYDFLDRPGGHKAHAQPVAYGGGLAVAATVVLVTAAGYAVVFSAPSWAPPELSVHFAGARAQLLKVGVLLACGLAILILGLIDDRRGLGAGVKLSVQLAVGAAFGWLVEPVGLFLGDGAAARAGQIAVTAVWIAGVINVFNIIDHMDGVCAGVAAIVCAAFTAVAVQTGQHFLAAMLLVLMGACAGFLLYNAHPATIFLGDAGSQFIGFMFGALTTVFTFVELEGDAYPLYRYFAPLAVLAVPLCDAAAVVLIRWRMGRPLHVGDLNHLAHRLVALGMTPRGAADTIYALTLFTGVSAVLLYLVKSTTAGILILAQVVVVFMLMRLLEAKGRSRGDTHE